MNEKQSDVPPLKHDVMWALGGFLGAAMTICLWFRYMSELGAASISISVYVLAVQIAITAIVAIRIGRFLLYAIAIVGLWGSAFLLDFALSEADLTDLFVACFTGAIMQMSVGLVFRTLYNKCERRTRR